MSNSVSACCHALIRVVSAPSESFLFCHKCGEVCRVKGEAMSEEKPLPCAYCRVVPIAEYFCKLGMPRVVIRSDCLICEAYDNAHVSRFNDAMTKLLELRRKDFAAGQESMDAYWDGELTMIRTKTFDDYIARKDDE